MNDTYIDVQRRDAMHCGRMKMLTLASGLIASVLVLAFYSKFPSHAQISCNYYRFA